MIDLLKGLALTCVSLAFAFIFARSVIEGIRTRKIFLKTVGYDQDKQPRMFAFAMGFNSLVAVAWLLSAAHFMLGGTL